MLPEDRRVRYEGGRVYDVEVESRAAFFSESVDVRVWSESDCMDVENVLGGGDMVKRSAYAGQKTNMRTLTLGRPRLSVGVAGLRLC